MASSTPMSDLHSRTSKSDATSLDCCCGRSDCALLKRNSNVLESLENDIHTAAQLGQALLARHEAYMADAERDRANLSTRIERLEMDKQELEAVNASKIEENHHLLDQLEALNTSVADSDTKIKSLEASLLSSQQAVRRLENAAARAADAERHLEHLEEEQLRLRNRLTNSQEDARSHEQRCKEAQRGILDMQDQLERMEDEARKERDRHAEVVERMEKQREVEKQLDTAAGRLKGAAASRSLVSAKTDGNSQVVGHFVRDLLEDNANLQLGIAELREMLMNSNDEIQSLREQLMYHQPMKEDGSKTPTLKAELDPATPQASSTVNKLSQEFHIHHHYHVTPKQETRKSKKKKRPGLSSGIFTPPVRTLSPSPASTGHWQLGRSPTAPPLLSSSLNDMPFTSAMMARDNTLNRYAETPSEFDSSIPSSPQSAHHNSLFDVGAPDTNAPISPSTSQDPMSPLWGLSHRKRTSETSARSLRTLSSFIDVPPSPPSGYPPLTHGIDSVIQEEEEDSHRPDEVPSLAENGTSIDDSTGESEYSRDEVMPRPRLYRALSHESIMSLTGGLDIHTLKTRPSQMTLRPIGVTEAVITGVTAEPTISRASTKRSDVALRDNFLSVPDTRSASSPHRQADDSSPANSWKWSSWRPWAGTPSSTVTSKKSSKAKSKEDDLFRTPGINQAGSIPGFQEYWASQKRKGAPAKVTTDMVDHEALIDGLGE